MGRKRRRGGKEGDALGPALIKRRKTAGTPLVAPGTSQHPSLCLYYPKVQTLREYLLSRLPATSKSRRRWITSLRGADRAMQPISCNNGLANDHSTLAALLDTTLVGICESTGCATNTKQDYEIFSQHLGSAVSSTLGGGITSQSEIVDFGIWLLFHKLSRHTHRPSHLLCHGYQRISMMQAANDDHGAVAGIPGLVSLYPNSHVAAIKSSQWSRLLDAMGKDGDQIMLDLILDCGLFLVVESGRNNYYQLSGVPLSDMQPIQCTKACTSVTGENGPEKSMPSKKKATVNAPSQIAFVRSRMMYSRSALNAKGEVQFGLRHIHVLNRYSDSGNPEHTVHHLKYIFPRQFGLHNVFTCSVDTRETSHAFKDYTLREQEIALDLKRFRIQQNDQCKKLGSRLPKRLRGPLFQLIGKLQRLHNKCSYLELLKYYCPVIAIDSRTRKKHSRRISRRPASEFQPTCSSATGAHPGAKSVWKSCLTDAATPTSQVSAFCRAVLRNVIPHEIWGSGHDGEENMNTILHNVDQFVHSRRFESLTLHAVCQKLKIRCITWLAPPFDTPSASTSKSDISKRREILYELVYYVFDSILIPLLRSHFHVTESNAHRNKLFFFRHDLWRAATEPSLATIKLSMFDEVPTEKAKRILDARNLGFSQIRLLPKENGFRPIMNLRRRTTKLQNGRSILGRSINSVLAPVHNMLSYEKSVQPGRLGSALFCVGDMYPRLKAFRARLKESGRQNDALYFVKVDVQSCFDTIPQRRVVQLMEQLCSETEYCIARHAEIAPSETHVYRDNSGLRSKPARKFVAQARSGQDFSTFHERLETGIARGKKNTVFVDTVIQSIQNKEPLLDLLEEHVEQNIVKVGKKFFRQKRGIPQGSVLSSFLCNFFYADFEAKYLGFLAKPEGVMLRLIDDFLLITTQKADALNFLRIMHGAHEDYGITVRAEKSLVNFKTCLDGIAVPHLAASAAFPYCGTMIHTQTLEIGKDRARMIGGVLADSLTVETSRVPGRSFHRKALNAFKILTQAMFVDTSMNSVRTVLANLYENLVESAMKTYRYAQCMGRAKQPASHLLIRTINDLSALAFVLIQSKHERHQATGFTCRVSKAQIEWLTLSAFRHVWGTKQSGYRDVIRWLDEALHHSAPAMGADATMLQAVIRKGNAVFAVSHDHRATTVVAPDKTAGDAMDRSPDTTLLAEGGGSSLFSCFVARIDSTPDTNPLPQTRGHDTAIKILSSSSSIVSSSVSLRHDSGLVVHPQCARKVSSRSEHQKRASSLPGNTITLAAFFRRSRGRQHEAPGVKMRSISPFILTDDDSSPNIHTDFYPYCIYTCDGSDPETLGHSLHPCRASPPFDDGSLHPLSLSSSPPPVSITADAANHRGPPRLRSSATPRPTARIHTRLRSLTAPLPFAHDAMTAFVQAPGSPPELTSSKSSKSSSFHSSSQSDDDAISSDLSHFEDIGLNDDHATPVRATHGPKTAIIPTPTYFRNASGAINGIKNNTPGVPGMRELVNGTTRPMFPSLQGQVRSVVNHTAAQSLHLPPGQGLRRTGKSPSSPSLALAAMRNRSRSRSPSPSHPQFNSSPQSAHPTSATALRPGTSPIMRGPSSRRGSFQPGRKTAKEIEDDYHDSDEDLPDDASLWNVPLSPALYRTTSTAVSSANPSPSTSPERSTYSNNPTIRINQSAVRPIHTAPAAGQAFRRERASMPSSPIKPAMPRGASTGMMPDHLPFKNRAKSWTVALSELSEEAKHLTEALDAHAWGVERESEESLQNGGSAGRPNMEKLGRSRTSVVELPPLRKSNVMIDPLPISKEKERVLSRTRPSWLPPKNQKEEKKHLKEYQRMMELSLEADKKRAAKAASAQCARDDTKATLLRIWEEHVLPNWDTAVREPRTRELWWKGIAPHSRAEVWKRAIGNELALTEATYAKALARAKALQQEIALGKRSGEGQGQGLEMRKEELWFRAIRRDVEGVWPDLKLFQLGRPLYGALCDLLMAFAIWRGDVGYCHGSHLPAALLLLNQPTPQAAFIPLANLLNRPLPLAFLTADPAGTTRTYHLVQALLAAKFPKLHTHLFTTLRLHPAQILDPLVRCLFLRGSYSSSREGNWEEEDGDGDGDGEGEGERDDGGRGDGRDERRHVLSLELASRIWDVMVFDGDAMVIRSCVAVLACLEAGLYGGREDVLAVLGWEGGGVGVGGVSGVSGSGSRSVGTGGNGAGAKGMGMGMEGMDEDAFMDVVRDVGKVAAAGGRG